MSRAVYVYTAAGVLVNDPERTTEYAQDIQTSSNSPGGYGDGSFKVQRHIARSWAIKQAYRLVVKDGHTTIYEGRIDDLNKSLSGSGQSVTVTAAGYYAVLKERKLRKRWIDNEPLSRMVEPAARKAASDQIKMDIDKRDDFITLKAGYGDVAKAANDAYHLQYSVPIGTLIRRHEALYIGRTGESITIIVYNDDGAAIETSAVINTGLGQSGNLNVTLAGGDTDSITLKFECDNADIYDENDYARVYNDVIYCHYAATHPDFASPTYTNTEIIKDVLILCGLTDLSTDYSLIANPAVVLGAFTTQSDNFETGDSIISRLCAYGDSSQNTYTLAVWGSDKSSDGKPQVELKARSTSSYEWRVSLVELDSFEDGLSLDELYNYVIVRYTDDEGQELFLTPDDNATLKDTTSITAYGRRDAPIVDAGKSTAATALAIGQRYLAYHKDPLRQSELGIRHTIRGANGGVWPVCRVSAGDRVYLEDYEGGVTYFLRQVKYTDKDELLRMTPDQPPDSLSVFLAQRELE